MWVRSNSRWPWLPRSVHAIELKGFLMRCSSAHSGTPPITGPVRWLAELDPELTDGKGSDGIGGLPSRPLAVPGVRARSPGGDQAQKRQTAVRQVGYPGER